MAHFSKAEEKMISSNDIGPFLRCCGFNPTEAEVREIKKESDPDEEGSITIMELHKWFNRKLKDSDTVEELIEAFKVFDTEGRNLISVAEMRHIMMNLGDKMQEDEIEDFIK